MSDKKQEKDFTPEVDALLPEAASLANVNLFVSEMRNTESVLYRQASYRMH